MLLFFYLQFNKIKGGGKDKKAPNKLPTPSESDDTNGNAYGFRPDTSQLSDKEVLEKFERMLVSIYFYIM